MAVTAPEPAPPHRPRTAPISSSSGTSLKQVERSYVEPVTGSDLVKDALKGMLTRLDPHSDYMDQEQYEQMTAVTRGQFGGIGVELTLEARVPEVIAPIDGTPAADAGIEPADRILKIDAQPTTWNGCRGDRQTAAWRARHKGHLENLARRYGHRSTSL